MPYANNIGTDQPAHSCSLIRAFVVRCLDSTIPLVSISEISSLYLAFVAEQAGLSQPWSQTLKTSFLVTWLILCFPLPNPPIKNLPNPNIYFFHDLEIYTLPFVEFFVLFCYFQYNHTVKFQIQHYFEIVLEEFSWSCYLSHTVEFSLFQEGKRFIGVTNPSFDTRKVKGKQK